MTNSEETPIFYQHPYEAHEMIFSGQLPRVEVPNFTLQAILDHFTKYNHKAMTEGFKFDLILRNNVHLSVIREKGYEFIEVAQKINGKMTRRPCFIHDGYGVATMALYDLMELINDLVYADTRGMDYVEGV